MVKIRLKRMGAKKRPFYRIVVADSRSPRDGRFIEALGTYDPLVDPPKAEVDGEKVLAWIGKGARPTDSARALLQREGILPRGPMIQYPPKEVAPEVTKEVTKDKAAEKADAKAPDAVAETTVDEAPVTDDAAADAEAGAEPAVASEEE